MATRKEVRFRVNLHLLFVAGVCCGKQGLNMPQEVRTQCYRSKKYSEGGKSLRESIRYPPLLPVSVQHCPTWDGPRCYLSQQPSV